MVAKGVMDAEDLLENSAGLLMVGKFMNKGFHVISEFGVTYAFLGSA